MTPAHSQHYCPHYNSISAQALDPADGQLRPARAGGLHLGAAGLRGHLELLRRHGSRRRKAPRARVRQAQVSWKISRYVDVKIFAQIRDL